jgi:hypothetical protein
VTLSVNVVFVAALLSLISPPSSPEEKFDTKLVLDVTLPVAKNEPVTCVVEFILTVEPSSSIFESAICSPL